MVDVMANVEVWCAECGKGLCSISRGDNSGLHVGMCPNCSSLLEEEAYERGFDAGRIENV